MSSRYAGLFVVSWVNILKPSLARGEIQVIGATTLTEYRKYVERDAALERRFQPINVDEPSKEETLEILKGIRDKYEAHHRVKITDAALEEKLAEFKANMVREIEAKNEQIDEKILAELK